MRVCFSESVQSRRKASPPQNIVTNLKTVQENTESGTISVDSHGNSLIQQKTVLTKTNNVIKVA